MTMTTKLIDTKALPRTYAAIQAEFRDPELRRELWSAAKFGSVAGVGRRIALTACGKASLDAVASVLAEEWAAAGFEGVCVGEADPEIYGPDQVAAYLDQPL